MPRTRRRFATLYSAEQAKTAALNADLNSTLEDLAAEQTALAARLQSIAAAVANAREQLERYDNTLAPDQGTLKELLDIRSTVEKHLGLYEQVARFEHLKQQLIDEQVRETASAAVGMQLSTVSTFSLEIAARLNAWGVPGADDTRYDKNNQDIISGDQPRSAHGKGVRAILHAAFTLGLAQYCFDRELPHPGFVVLDSPLVTYRPPEQGGDADRVLPPSVIEQFYADIQNGFDGQVIVLENTEPPAGLGPDCVDVVFTKNESYGRYGFFPLRPAILGDAAMTMNPGATAAPPLNTADELAKLASIRDKGALTEDEYQAQKAKLPGS